MRYCTVLYCTPGVQYEQYLKYGKEVVGIEETQAQRHLPG